MKKWLTIVLCLFITYPVIAQVFPTPTPVIVNLLTPTPRVQQSIATVTPTFTATPLGPVLLEAKPEVGAVNVRTEPGPNADRLGTISNGIQYPVYRRFYNWYELEFELSQNGRAWVFAELVDIIGDETAIEVIEGFDWSTPQSVLNVGPTDITPLSEEQIATATADARVLAVPTTIQNQANSAALIESTPLPTFTYPPNVSLQIPTESPNILEVGGQSRNQSGTPDLPPIMPILVLGGLGIVGTLINALRR